MIDLSVADFWKGAAFGVIVACIVWYLIAEIMVLKAKAEVVKARHEGEMLKSVAANIIDQHHRQLDITKVECEVCNPFAAGMNPFPKEINPDG